LAGLIARISLFDNVVSQKIEDYFDASVSSFPLGKGISRFFGALHIDSSIDKDRREYRFNNVIDAASHTSD
jgi:hypothetical protein